MESSRQLLRERVSFRGLLPSVSSTTYGASQPFQLVVVVIPAAFPSADDDVSRAILFPIVLRHRAEELLELLLRHAAAQLSRARQHDQTVLDIGRARLLY